MGDAFLVEDRVIGVVEADDVQLDVATQAGLLAGRVAAVVLALFAAVVLALFAALFAVVIASNCWTEAGYVQTDAVLCGEAAPREE